MRPLPSRRALIVAPLLASTPAAAAPGLSAAERELVGDLTPSLGGIALRGPATAENGAQVPLTVTVESPQTAELHLTALHLLAPRNPTPGIASFRFGPALARAEVQTRARLAESQTVVALAVMSDGTLRRATAEVTVSTGGCVA